MLKRIWNLPSAEMCAGIKANELADILEERIVTNRIPVGMRLPPEREISKECGINRSTVQRAIQLLEQRGIVEMQHGSGTYVKDLEYTVLRDTLKRYFVHSRSTPEDILSVRLFLESGAASIAATSANDLQLEELRTCLEEFEEAYNLGNNDKRVDADIRFHETIVEAARNPMLVYIMKSLHEIIFGLMISDTLDQRLQARTKESIQIHRGILEAITDRNPELAEEAIRRHMAFTNLIRKGEPVDLLTVNRS